MPSMIVHATVVATCGKHGDVFGLFKGRVDAKLVVTNVVFDRLLKILQGDGADDGWNNRCAWWRGGGSWSCRR